MFEMADEGVMSMARNRNEMELDKLLHVKFFRKALYDKPASEGYVNANGEALPGAGRPIYKDVDFIAIGVPGDRCSIIERKVIVDATNPMADSERFKEKYHAYKAGLDQEATSGTPLSVLTAVVPPLLSLSQVEELRHVRVTTAEQLVAIPDSLGQQFMGIHEIKRRVKTYLDAAASEAPQAALRSELDDKDNQIAALQSALKELAERVDAQARPAKRPAG